MIASTVFKVSILFAITSLFVSTVRADQDSDAIIQATMRFVFQEASVDDPSVTIEKIVPGFARVGVISISGKTDPATVYLKGGNGVWKVITLGTAFAPEDLSELGIPASLAK